MSMLRALRLSRAPAFGLAAVGMLWGGFSALSPDIMDSVNASYDTFGKVLLMSAVGGMIAMVVAPRIGRMLGHLALPVAGFLLCAAFLYPTFATSVVTLSLAMLAMGASVALLDITANVEISARETRHGLHLMNVNHAIFSFVFAATAYGTGLARRSGFGPDDVLPVLALMCVPMAFLMWSSEKKTFAANPQESGLPKTVPWFAISLTGLILLASFIGENSTEIWSAVHIERILGAAAGDGSFGPAMLGLVMGIGRLMGQVAAERLGHGRVIFWSGALGIIGTLIIVVAPTVGIVILGVAVVALGMAVIVPSANSILGVHVTDAQRSHALSRAWMFGIIGFFIGPALMGGIAELFGLRWSFAIISLIVALILPAVWMLERHKPER